MDEEGAGVTHVDEAADMAVGQASDLAVKLEPGRYGLFATSPRIPCTIWQACTLYFR